MDMKFDSLFLLTFFMFIEIKLDLKIRVLHIYI
jgi:hypothetical protein